MLSVPMLPKAFCKRAEQVDFEAPTSQSLTVKYIVESVMEAFSRKMLFQRVTGKRSHHCLPAIRYEL